MPDKKQALAGEGGKVAGWPLAKALYDAFWARNKSPGVINFADQATAIRQMWFEIGRDAVAAQSATQSAQLARMADFLRDIAAMDVRYDDLPAAKMKAARGLEIIEPPAARAISEME